MENNYIAVYITAGNEEEAVKLGKGLVDNRLAACANLVRAVRSIYRWKGQLCDENETLIIAKSRKELFHKIKDFIKNNHSYEVPEIIAVPIVSGLASYLDWIDENTQK